MIQLIEMSLLKFTRIISYFRKIKRPLPRGPFIRHKVCDLLIFVPVSLESHLINHLTGGYGFSHLAVDCGEIDMTTGKAVMTESLPKTGVHRAFQDEYGQRDFVRIPITDIRKCIISRLGEPYDIAEALTFATIDDPTKQICIDLVTNCLPKSVQTKMIQAYREGRINPGAMSINHDLFVSPNGFAQFLLDKPMSSKGVLT